MRVITGIARGAKLETPAGLETRPTSDMAKEAMFSILQFELPQAMVLDLFAGSGQLGIEALSRGAKSCVFVDRSRDAQEVIRKNLAHTKLSPLGRVAAMEAKSFLSGCRDQFDIALLDPPYGGGLLEELLPLVAACMNDNGVIVCESEKKDKLPEAAGTFSLHKSYQYGKAQLTTYRKIQKEETTL